MSCKEKNWYVQENITAFSIKQLSKSRTRLDAQVAQVNKRGFLADKAKEHADLIAAAPELLDAVISAHTYLCDKDPRADARLEIQTLLENLIAKATKGEI